MELIGLFVGIGLLFYIPIVAARDQWPDDKGWATVGALAATAAWCALCLWAVFR